MKNNLDNWFLKSKYFKISIPTPLAQALGILSISLVMMLGAALGGNKDFPWLVSGAFLLLFVVFNNALGIFAENMFKYLQHSIYSFMGLIVSLGLLSYLVSGQSIFAERGQNRTIYIILVLAYFSLLALAFMIRSIADYLQKRDEILHKKGRL